jgi:hypothetical protein
MSERQTTRLNIHAGVRVGATFMADNTVIDLGISTHLQDGGILSEMSQHLTLADAKTLVIAMTYAIAEVEAELAGEPTLSKEVVL